MSDGYEVWQYVGFSMSAMREAVHLIDEGDAEGAKEKLKRALREYQSLCEANGIPSLLGDK